MRRLQAYRQARKPLRFQIYVFLEFCILSCLLVSWILQYAGMGSLWALIVGVVLAMFHHFKMVLEKPWKLLKCAAVAVGVFFGLNFLDIEGQSQLMTAISAFILYFMVDAELEIFREARLRF